MELTKKNQPSIFGKQPANDNEAVKKWIFLILSHWHLFVVFVLLGLTVSYYVVRNTIPIFRVVATVLIKPEAKTLASESFMMGGFESSDYKNFINQTILLKTPSQILKTLSQLDFNICYFSKGRFNVREFYPDMPFGVVIDSTHIQPLNLEIHLEPASKGKIRLIAEGKNISLYNFQLNKQMGTMPLLMIDQELMPGQTLTTENFSFKITKTLTELTALVKEGDYYFVFKSNQGLVGEFSTLQLDYAEKGATVVNLSHTGSNLEKSKTFLNQLMTDWIQSELDSKNEIANNTMNFINNQLMGLGDTLDWVSRKLQNFRTSNNVVSPEIQIQSSYAKLEGLDIEQTQLQLQIAYLDQLNSYLSKREDYNKLIAPSAVGLDFGSFGTYLQQLSEIRGELFQYMGQSKLNNPYLLNQQKQENILLTSIQEYIKNVKENIDMKMKQILTQKKRFVQEQNRQPAKEQELFGIERSFQTIDNLYTLLQEKSIETQIKKASNVANNQVVEMAEYAGLVKPEKSKILAIGFLIGLIIPLLYLFLTDLLNNKIQSGDDIKQLTRVPLYGSITEGKEDVNFITMEKPRSPTSEAFRALRTRIDFLTKEQGQKGQQSTTIMISSSVSGEGKTFCAINLAGIIALSGKKTIVLGLDLRKPRFGDYFKTESKKGITNFLIDDAKLDEVVQTTGYENLDCIVSGPIPPNPAELVTTPKMGELFNALKERYDYIIIDTSPIGLVTDALLLSPYCNNILFVARHRVTIKQLFAYNISLIEDSGISSLGVILNGIKTNKRGMGMGMGMGTGMGMGMGMDLAKLKVKRNHFGKEV